MARFSTGCLIALFLVGPMEAQELTGTLGRIADSGELRIGYVPDAPPMSFRDSDGNVAGYSIDLCRVIAAEVRNVVGLSDLMRRRVSFLKQVRLGAQKRRGNPSSGDGFPA